MPWGIAAGAVASVASSALSSKGKGSGGSTSQETSSAPWEAQQPYLKNGMATAETLLGHAQKLQLPEDFVAGQNDYQGNANSALFRAGADASTHFAPWRTFGHEAAWAAPQQMRVGAEIAGGGIGSRSADTDFLSQYARTGVMPGQQQDPAMGQLQTGFNGAAAQGLNSLGQGQTALNQGLRRGADDAAASAFTIRGATDFANNAGLDGQIDAANRDVARNLGENELRGIRTAGMASGNTNSSREGALEAIATRGAADRMADTSAAMRGAAYAQGGQMAANAYGQGTSAILNAGQGLTANGSVAAGMANSQFGRQDTEEALRLQTRLQAANQAASQSLGYDVANTNARLSGNQQVGQSLDRGLNSLQSAYGAEMAGINGMYTAGQREQQGSQANISNNLARYQAHATGQFDLLDRYWNVVGKPLGTEGTQSSEATTPKAGVGGLISKGIGGGVAGYGLAQNFQGASSGSPFGGSAWGGPVDTSGFGY